MSIREIEIIIRGRIGSGVQCAADTAATTLEAAGGSVDLRSSLSRDVLYSEALRGVRALIRVEQEAAPRPAPGVGTSPSGEAAPSLLGTITRVGAVLLLILFNAELRLNFGLRLDTIVTLGGIWAFWHFCLSRTSSSP
jgi:hypothetical protein